jgi:hypothetical protein
MAGFNTTGLAVVVAIVVAIMARRSKSATLR